MLAVEGIELEVEMIELVLAVEGTGLVVEVRVIGQVVEVERRG